MMNSAFIQGFEIDDYHAAAPVHNCSIMIPTLIAATESLAHRPGYAPKKVSGAEFLLSAIAGFESGIRIGKAIYGNELLNRGWHCGAVYGSPGSAAAASKLFQLSQSQTEDVIGIACTQACGLMAAQFSGMVKRVQHGFATRNGLVGAFLARGGYEGFKNGLEQPYGGFFLVFSLGNGRDPPYKENAVVEALGTNWETMLIVNKLHAAVGTTHGMIEALEILQAKHPAQLTPSNLENIKSIHIAKSLVGIQHDGWALSEDQRPLDAIGAQMCGAYVSATQLVDEKVLPAQFGPSELDRDEVWSLVWKTKCEHDPYFDQNERLSGAKEKVTLSDGVTLEAQIDAPRGYEDRPVENIMILEKFRNMTEGILDNNRRSRIEGLVSTLEHEEDIRPLIDLLAHTVGKVLK